MEMHYQIIKLEKSYPMYIILQRKQKPGLNKRCLLKWKMNYFLNCNGDKLSKIENNFKKNYLVMNEPTIFINQTFQTKSNMESNKHVIFLYYKLTSMYTYMDTCIQNAIYCEYVNTSEHFTKYILSPHGIITKHSFLYWIHTF